MRSVVAAVAAGLVLTACAAPTEDEPAPAAACEEVPEVGLSSIAEGLVDGGEYTAGQAVEVEDPEFGMAYAVAVDGPGGVAVFGMGEPAEGGGPIVAANDVAQETTEWGAAATDGSPMADARDALASSDEASAAVECLG